MLCLGGPDIVLCCIFLATQDKASEHEWELLEKRTQNDQSSHLSLSWGKNSQSDCRRLLPSNKFYRSYSHGKTKEKLRMNQNLSCKIQHARCSIPCAACNPTPTPIPTRALALLPSSIPLFSFIPTSPPLTYPLPTKSTHRPRSHHPADPSNNPADPPARPNPHFPQRRPWKRHCTKHAHRTASTRLRLCTGTHRHSCRRPGWRSPCSCQRPGP